VEDLQFLLVVETDFQFTHFQLIEDPLY